jgi:hypothetical protein
MQVTHRRGRVRVAHHRLDVDQIKPLQCERPERVAQLVEPQGRHVWVLGDGRRPRPYTAAAGVAWFNPQGSYIAPGQRLSCLRPFHLTHITFGSVNVWEHGLGFRAVVWVQC